jgi:hypothetical protein
LSQQIRTKDFKIVELLHVGAAVVSDVGTRIVNLHPNCELFTFIVCVGLSGRFRESRNS